MRPFVVLSVVVLAALSAEAGTEIRRSGLQSHLINDVRVQRELKLTEAQRDAAYDIRWRASGQIGDIIREHLRKKESPDRKKDGEAEARINAELAASLAKLLDPEQYARYEQIRLQYLREEALLEPSVQKAIKLDEGRAEKLASIFSGYLEGVDRRLAESEKLPRREQFRLVSQRLLEDMTRRDEALKRMRELLTDEQRAAFEDLKGPRFQIEGREDLGAFERQAPAPKR